MRRRGMSVGRRQFLGAASAGLAAGSVWSGLPARASVSPNEKLAIAAVGTGGMAAADLKNLAGEEIVAICDVDEKTLATAATLYPRSERYHDFRLMLEQEAGRIDAVLVATPDHLHATATMMALKMGKHVYCEKPLTWSVQEARTVAAAAAERRLVTQMGIGVHATDNYRRVVELVRSGVVGPIREVVVWCNKAWGGDGRVHQPVPAPATLHWDLWLGPAAARDYAAGAYHPGQWRRWWAFGGGTLGDMACHLVDLPFWALELTLPESIEAQGPPPDPETAPPDLSVTYRFPARGQLPPVKLTWHDGTRAPKEVAGYPVPAMGVMFVGETGSLFADYGSWKLLPADRFTGFVAPPQSIPKSVGHWQEWIDACKTGGPTTCDFAYSARLTETVLLGNVAYRSGRAISWDAAAGKPVDCPEAEPFLAREYRRGWTL